MKIPPSPLGKTTAFVREVVMPGLGDVEPVINPQKCWFRLEYHRSPIHRWGIFAGEDIPRRRRVIEYTGQKINEAEVWRRSLRQHLYIFCLDENWALDGAFGGSGAEFINHSCDPNLETTITGGRIFLKSRRPIITGEELTLNYNLGEDGPLISCKCGVVNCEGTVAY